jgi:SAM-dependent methyltransferase
MTTRQFDAAKAEAFQARMLDVLNGGALALMTSIGHQTGLFDAMAGRPSLTACELAAATGLQERYVREWLAAMATGRVLELEPGSGRYRLPEEHSAVLTRAAGAHNLALQAQYLPLLASVEQPVIACFRDGGGVPYPSFQRFHAVMAEESASVHDVALLDVTLPLVPGAVQWLRAGCDVLDVGCGRGHALNLMARAFPASRFVGYDLSSEAIATARAGAERLGLANARFETRDVTQLDHENAFDLVTAFDAIHDQGFPAQVLRGIARALRPGGAFLMVDIAAASSVAGNLDHPLGPFLYTVSCMHCMTVSLAQGGVGLGTMWGEELARQLLAEAGFSKVEVTRIESDPINAYFVATR